MEQHQVNVFEFLLEKLPKTFMRRLIKPDVQLRIRGAEAVDGGNGAGPFMLHQIGQRPATQFLIAADAVSHARELAHQAAQKMRITVVPVRDQRMREQRNVESLFHATAAPSPWSGAPGEPGFGSLGWRPGQHRPSPEAAAAGTRA